MSQLFSIVYIESNFSRPDFSFTKVLVSVSYLGIQRDFMSLRGWKRLQDRTIPFRPGNRIPLRPCILWDKEGPTKRE